MSSKEGHLNSLLYFHTEKDITRMSGLDKAIEVLDERSKFALKEFQDAQALYRMRSDQFTAELNRQLDEVYNASDV